MKIKSIKSVTNNIYHCNKCEKQLAEYYVERETENGSIDVPLCGDCTGLLLKILDVKLVKNEVMMMDRLTERVKL